jgi:dihydroxyacetone kinase-like predicted kinase
MTAKYSLEFILHAKDSSAKIIKNALAEFGSELAVADCQKSPETCNYKVNMVTEDPTLVFDLCSQLGRIRSVKVHESRQA